MAHQSTYSSSWASVTKVYETGKRGQGVAVSVAASRSGPGGSFKVQDKERALGMVDLLYTVV